MTDWTLRTRFVLFFAALALGGIAVVAGALWFSQSRSGAPVSGYVIAGVISGFGLIAICTWIGFLFDQNVARPIEKLASELRTRAEAGVMGDINLEDARYLGALAPAAQALNLAFRATRAEVQRELDARLAEATRDKGALETLLKELADGLVVISADGRVLLYNRSAVALLGPLGLNRPLTGFMRTDPVIDAINRLAGGGRAEVWASTSFLTSSTDDQRLFLGAVSDIDLGDDRLGHALLIRDITVSLSSHVRLEQTLGSKALSGTTKQEQLAGGHWPICPTSLERMFGTLELRIGLPVKVTPHDGHVYCDAFAVRELFGTFEKSLEQAGDAHDLTLLAEENDEKLDLVLGWRGSPGVSDLETWMKDRLCPAYGPYTRADVLTAHRSMPRLERDGDRHRFVVPLCPAPGPKDKQPANAPEFYDFDLYASQDEELLDRRLADLSFVVFDTETTGLDRNTDEVVQIGGVRILMGRLLKGERFDELVNPGRPIPLETTRIHGISNEMVAGARRFPEVGRDFQAFAEGSAFVAHNADFDMAFLKRLQRAGGADFSNPFVCTARLSTHLFPHTGDHTLDGLAERLAIEIPEEVRHTALGDAIATAEVFMKMIVLLENQGVRTLRDALTLTGDL